MRAGVCGITGDVGVIDVEWWVRCSRQRVKRVVEVGGECRGGLEYFCFQAEDGIRELVRSRGLGEVYKRQVPVPPIRERTPTIPCASRPPMAVTPRVSRPVSYTHLTLPTTYSV